MDSDYENTGSNGVVMGEGGIIPSGRYRAKALPETAIWGTASTGTKQVGMSFEITDGKYAKTTLPWYGFFTAESKDRTIESLVIAGCTFEDNDLTNLEGLGSQVVEISVETEENPDGELRSRVSWVNAPGTVAMKEQFDEDQAKAFAKSMTADLLKIKKKKGLKKPSKAAKPSASESAAATK